MDDASRDRILTELQIGMGRVTTLLEQLPEKFSQAQNERSELFQRTGTNLSEINDLKRWRAEESGRASARGSAWGASKWIVGTLITVASICGGVLSAALGALFGK